MAYQRAIDSLCSAERLHLTKQSIDEAKLAISKVKREICNIQEQLKNRLVRGSLENSKQYGNAISINDDVSNQRIPSFAGVVRREVASLPDSFNQNINWREKFEGDMNKFIDSGKRKFNAFKFKKMKVNPNGNVSFESFETFYKSKRPTTSDESFNECLEKIGKTKDDELTMDDCMKLYQELKKKPKI
ncbi:hypothetical protein GJ496_008738 [Pomphorhynchus laevis]|nr:hypothetical protein GJ496_008738 [Pomphorhynchus laevis]